MLEMAKKLEISVAYLSAIETDRKTPPVDFAGKIIKSYGLGAVDAERLKQLCNRARETFTINATSTLQRDTAAELQAGFTRLNDDQLTKIKLILGSK